MKKILVLIMIAVVSISSVCLLSGCESKETEQVNSLISGAGVGVASDSKEDETPTNSDEKDTKRGFTPIIL